MTIDRKSYDTIHHAEYAAIKEKEPKTEKDKKIMKLLKEKYGIEDTK